MAKEMSIFKTDNRITDLIEKAVACRNLSNKDIVRLLSLTSQDAEMLFAAADSVRKQYVGDEVYLRGIIEFSNYCERNCLYCGLRVGNPKLQRYRMTEDEIIATAKQVKEMQVPTIVLQSGEDTFFTTDILCRIIQRIRKETGLIITLSIGERSYEDFQAFQKAGADRYLLKHETASAELFQQMRPGCKLTSRMQCLQWLKELGMETGTGNMVGLPGQTLETLASDLLFMKQLDADMLGIGPFIAHPDTPLVNLPNGSIDLTLKVLAIARLITRDTNIPATTALGTLDAKGRLKALQAGANVVMPDFTPLKYKSLYDIYPGRADVGRPADIIAKLKNDLASIGRTIHFGAGYRPNKSINSMTNI
jgi:biotin synthase